MVKLIDVAVIKAVRSHENRPVTLFRDKEGYDIEWHAEDGVVRVRREGFDFVVDIPVTNVSDWRLAEEKPVEELKARKGRKAAA